LAELEKQRQEAASPNVTVIFFRKYEIIGYAETLYLTHNNSQIGEIINAASFVYSTTPGKHTFGLTYPASHKIENTFEFEPDQTYYILSTITLGRRISLQLVSEEVGSMEIKKAKEKKLEQEKINSTRSVL